MAIPRYSSWLQRLALASAASLFCVAAAAGPLEDWAEEWKAGTAFADNPDYQHVYAETHDRDIRFLKQLREGDVVIALYEARLTAIGSGKHTVEQGVAAYYLKEEKPIYVEFSLLEKHQVDQALAGQVADVATTAVGIAAGLAEANPAMAGLAGGGPAGLLAMLAVKVGLSQAANGASLRNCISTKQVASGMGWGAAAWNIGMLAGVPALGILGAIIAAANTSDRQTALRTCATLKLAKVE